MESMKKRKAHRANQHSQPSFVRRCENRLRVAITIGLGVSLSLALGVAGVGCDNAKQDLNDIFHLNYPTPSEAATWMFHRDPERRRLGIALISNAPFGGDESYMEVYRKAVSDTDPLVRAAAAHALGMHGFGQDAMLITPLLSEDSKIVRWESAKALQRIHNPEAVGVIITAMLGDDDPDVRMEAASSLGQYPEHRVVEALISALGDRSLSVNQLSRRSLRTLTGEDFGTQRGDWIDWFRDVENPFAGQREYLYPVYERDLDWFEKVTPWGASEFEQSAQPRGMQSEDPDPLNTDAITPADDINNESATPEDGGL